MLKGEKKKKKKREGNEVVFINQRTGNLTRHPADRKEKGSPPFYRVGDIRDVWKHGTYKHCGTCITSCVYLLYLTCDSIPGQKSFTVVRYCCVVYIIHYILWVNCMIQNVHLNVDTHTHTHTHFAWPKNWPCLKFHRAFDETSVHRTETRRGAAQRSCKSYKPERPRVCIVVSSM